MTQVALGELRIYERLDGLEEGFKRTSQVATEHEIEHEETVLIVLKSVAEVDDEWVVDLNVVVSVPIACW